MDEVKDFHPLVERWLNEHGYDCQHHVELEHGIVDFIATHRETGEVLCVECKTRQSVSTSVAAQVLLYNRQVPHSIPCIALPVANPSKNSQKICKRFKIRLLSVELSDSDRRSIRARQTNRKTPKKTALKRDGVKIKERSLSFVRRQSDMEDLRMRWQIHFLDRKVRELIDSGLMGRWRRS